MPDRGAFGSPFRTWTPSAKRWLQGAAKAPAHRFEQDGAVSERRVQCPKKQFDMLFMNNPG
jgi:hypothetical protein